MLCQKLQEQLNSCQEQVKYHRSMHADAITARNTAWSRNDDLQDILRSKAEEIGKLTRQVYVLEREKRHSRNLVDDETSNTEKLAEIFKQQLVEEQTKVCDLQLQLARLKDHLRSANRKYSLLSESGDFDSGTFVEPHKVTSYTETIYSISVCILNITVVALCSRISQPHQMTVYLQTCHLSI